MEAEIERRNGDSWEALDIKQSFSDDGLSGKLRAGGVALELTRTSDGGYSDDEQGFTSVGGEMVEFDMNPNKSSWSERSRTFRPGLGAPTAKGGKAKYEDGPTEKIGKTWQEDLNKGSKAKIFDRSGNWIGEWINLNPAEYFYGNRKDVEKHSGWVAMAMPSWSGITMGMASLTTTLS